MKIAIVLSLLAIGYLIYWNSRRVASGLAKLKERQGYHTRIDELMVKFGQNRARLATIKQEYANLFGQPADKDPQWASVDHLVQLSIAKLTIPNFELAAHFMEQAVTSAQEVFSNRESERNTTLAAVQVLSVIHARDLEQGESQPRSTDEAMIRDCVQASVDRRG